MVALMFRMATTLGLLPTVITVDRLTRYPSATTLTDVRDMAPSARHPLRGYLSASHHIVPPSSYMVGDRAEVPCPPDAYSYSIAFNSAFSFLAVSPR